MINDKYKAFHKKFLSDMVVGIDIILSYLVHNQAAFRNCKDMFRPYFLNDPEWAFYFAYQIDRKPRDDTREVSCRKAKYAFNYAYHIDEKAREDTRIASCKEANFAYDYALYIDREPREDTRTAACKDPEFAYEYALDVDHKPLLETYNAVRGTKYKIQYIEMIGKPEGL